MKHPYKIDLNEALQHPGRQVEYNISTKLSGLDDIELFEPVVGTLTALSTGNALILTGDFSCSVWVECSRCALRVAETFSFQLEESFQVEGTASSLSHRSQAVVVQDEPFPIFDENNLLADELMHQHLVLNMPIQPVCRESCKGICPICGVSLNETTCDCQPDKAHPALEELGNAWYDKKKTQQ